MEQTLFNVHSPAILFESVVCECVSIGRSSLGRHGAEMCLIYGQIDPDGSPFGQFASLIVEHANMARVISVEAHE